MTQLKPLNLWVVELPEGATYVKINEYNDLWFDVPGKTLDWVELPEGKWKALFTTATATEQDWDAVLPKESDPLTGDEYLDFITGKYIHHLSYKSGYSLLAANGLEVEKNYAILTLKNK